MKLWLIVKGMLSKNSKIKVGGLKKDLIIYDWVLESAYNKRQKVKNLVEKKSQVAPIGGLSAFDGADINIDNSPRKRLKSMNRIKRRG